MLALIQAPPKLSAFNITLTEAWAMSSEKAISFLEQINKIRKREIAEYKKANKGK